MTPEEYLKSQFYTTQLREARRCRVALSGIHNDLVGAAKEGRPPEMTQYMAPLVYASDNLRRALVALINVIGALHALEEIAE